MATESKFIRTKGVWKAIGLDHTSPSQFNNPLEDNTTVHPRYIDLFGFNISIQNDHLNYTNYTITK